MGIKDAGSELFARRFKGKAGIAALRELSRVWSRTLPLRRGVRFQEPQREAGAGEMLAVATYNIHSCVGPDGRYAPERVAAVLRELDADIVALQEVGRYRSDAAIKDQAKFLAEATGLQVIAVPEQHDYRGRFGNAILSRWPAARLRVLDLTAGIHGPRNAIDAEFEIDGRLLRVIATHFGLGGLERQRQTRRLLDAIADWPGADGAHNEVLVSALLMLGDLNEWRGRQGSLGALERRLGPMPLRPTFPSWLPLLPLDRIYAPAPARLRDFRVHHSAVARKASDHLPLYARLVWPNEKQGRTESKRDG